MNSNNQNLKLFHSIPLTKSFAERARDSLAKTIYTNLHQWIISRINMTLDSKQSCVNYIGILDIPGFGTKFPGFYKISRSNLTISSFLPECFANNSFEQLNINFANECFQRFCIERVIKNFTLSKHEEIIGTNSIQILLFNLLLLSLIHPIYYRFDWQF